MTSKDNLIFLKQLDLDPFKERFPWLGGDLQTLRDTFVEDALPVENGEHIYIDVPSNGSGLIGEGKLLALLDRPSNNKPTKGLVVMLHGLGGSSKRRGLRRMAFSLIDSGFAVLRLNLRGASPSRDLAGGTYAAECNTDIFPVLKKAREITKSFNSFKGISTRSQVPLLGVGISLGGTILLNACLGQINKTSDNQPALDGLICISSPLDLGACSTSIERPRNSFYQYWLLNRLLKQTVADPFGISDYEKNALSARNNFNLPTINSIRDFDAVITSPRWCFSGVDNYYQKASPLEPLMQDPKGMPQTFIIQADDDPWVPSGSAKELHRKLNERNSFSNLRVILTPKGGHNGFHGVNGCWGDALVIKLINKIVS